MKIAVKFYNRTTTQECSDSCAKCVVSLRPDSHSPHLRGWPARLPSVVKTESDLYVRMHTTCVHITHTHWVCYPVCQRPIPETKHQTPCKPCTKQDMCMKPIVIPLTPQGHFARSAHMPCSLQLNYHICSIRHRSWFVAAPPDVLNEIVATLWY